MQYTGSTMARAQPPGRNFYISGPQPPTGSYSGALQYGKLSLWYYQHDQFWVPEVEYYSRELLARGYDTRYWQHLLRPNNGVRFNAVWLKSGWARWTGDPGCQDPQLLATDAERRRKDMLVSMKSDSAFDERTGSWYRWAAVDAPTGSHDTLLAVVEFFRRNTSGFGWFVAATVEHERRTGPPRTEGFIDSWLIE